MAGSPGRVPGKRPREKNRSLMWVAVAGAICVSVLGVVSLRPWEWGDQFGAQRRLRVCIASNDFWGLPTAGGTATALGLLASLLASSPKNNVTFLGVWHDLEYCESGADALANTAAHFECLQPRHFNQTVVRTNYYEHVGHAILNWLREDPDRCDVLHNHEWGGIFSQSMTVQHHRQMKPGFRMSTQPHGGYFWSSWGQESPISHLFALRQDHMERMTLHLSDGVISPSAYMVAYLRQRGWTLPMNNTVVIPNVMADLPSLHSSSSRSGKKVWRLCFFSRLEERKGIKVFVEALKLLPTEGLPTKFEVLFLGAEHEVDMQPSTEWLAEQTASFTFPVIVKTNTPRTLALSILAEPGMLIVFNSLVENLPYTVMETASLGIPMIVTDSGGTLEMLDREASKDAIVTDNTPQGVCDKLVEILTRGTMKPASLSKRVTNGGKTWLRWHTDFSASTAKRVREDRAFAKRVTDTMQRVEVVRIPSEQRSLDLWEPMCLESSLSRQPVEPRPVLLLPEEYNLAEPAAESLAMMSRIMAASDLLQPDGIAAFSFGAILPSGTRSFPSSPTWILYGDGEDRNDCVENIPILIRKDVFCDRFFAEARIFKNYKSWVLAMVLHQSNLHVQPYPEAIFTITNYTRSGYSCNFDRFPLDRQMSFEDVAHLMTSTEDIMRNIHMARMPDPLASFNADYLKGAQGHNGWSIGHTPRYASAKTNISLLTFFPEEHNTAAGKWGCQTDFPYFRSHLLHPCAGPPCCGTPEEGPFKTDSVVRLRSHWSSPQSRLDLAFTVLPACGDGLDVSLYMSRMSEEGILAPQERLFHAAYEPAKKEDEAEYKGYRLQRTWLMDVGVGDTIDLVIDPRETMDCDGVYIIDYKLWPTVGIAPKKLVKKAAEDNSPDEEEEKKKAAEAGGADAVAKEDDESFYDYDATNIPDPIITAASDTTVTVKTDAPATDTAMTQELIENSADAGEPGGEAGLRDSAAASAVEVSRGGSEELLLETPGERRSGRRHLHRKP